MSSILLAGTAVAQSLLDVNAATVQQLDALPGIGPSKAHALVLWREESGPCRSVGDLAEVPGWGPATLAALRSRITCGPGARPEPRGPVRDELPDGPALHTELVNINEAGIYELVELPGITLSRARDIVAHREAHGPFASCAELDVLPGIGDATLSLLADRCTVTRARLPSRKGGK